MAKTGMTLNYATLFLGVALMKVVRTWDSKTVSLYFPVPSNLKTFDVTYFGHKVASGTVP